jgi:hypothetical protein
VIEASQFHVIEGREQVDTQATEGSTLKFFLGSPALGGQFLQPLLPPVPQTLDRGSNPDFAPLEECEAMFAALADGCTNDLPTAEVYKELRFLDIALLFPTVVPPLFFCGRSSGLSVASMTMTSTCVPSSRNFFLPGK